MRRFLSHLFPKSRNKSFENHLHNHLTLNTLPATIYAIGDVHGRLDLAQKLESKIIEDAAQDDGEKLIIYIGDLIDRGPQSAQMIDHLLSGALEAQNGNHILRECIIGNHELMMLDYCLSKGKNKHWLKHGGLDTLKSYYVNPDVLEKLPDSNKSQNTLIDSHIPEEHLDYLKARPATISTMDYIFAHAGIRPNIELEQQTLTDITLIRDGFLDNDTDHGKIVVHGHTVVTSPEIQHNRINVDTGAYATGCLTAVKLKQGHAPLFLSTN